MHDGDSAPSCCAFTHWVAFEEVSGPRVLFKSGQGNRGLSACGTTHGASLKFPSEAGYILRYAGKAGEPSRQRRGIDSPVAIRRGEGAQMKWGQNPRCYPRGNPACRGTFGGRMKAVRDRFALQGGTGDFPSYAVAGKGVILRRRGTHVVFLELRRILELRRGSQASSWVGPAKPNLPLELRGKAGGCTRVTAGPKTPHLGVCPGPNIPLQGRQGSRGCIPGYPGESGLVSRGSQGLRSPLESRPGSLGAP